MAAHRWIFILLLCHLLVLLIINLAVAAPVDNGSHEMTHSGDGEIEESKAESDKHDVINNENVSLDVEDVEDDPDEDAVSKDKEEIKETSSKSQELEHEEDDEEEGKPEEETVNNESSSKKENAEEVESAKSSEVVVTEDSEERKKEDLSTENDLGDLEKGSQEVLPKEAEESTESVHNNGNEETILDNKHHMLPEEHGSTTNLGSDQSGHIIQDSSEKLGDAEKSKEIEETMEETDAPDSEIFKHIDDDQARSMPLSGSLLGISEEENVEDEDGTGIDHENESNDDNHEDNGNEDTVGTAEVKSAIEKSEENEPVPVVASTGDSVGSMEHPLEKNKMDVTHEEEDDGDADSSNAEQKTSENHNSAEVETVASEEKSEAEYAILPIKNEGDNGASHEKNEEETDGTHEKNEAAVPHESNEDETRTTHENNEDDVAEGHENSEDDVGHENENETEDAHEKNEDGTDVTDSGKVDTGTSNVVDNKDETHVADVENETDAAANDEYYDDDDDDDDDDANDDKDGTDVVAGRADGDSTENKDDTDVAKDEENETDVADDHEDETGVADDNEDETEHVNSEHETDVTHEAIEDETAAVHENNEDDTPVSNENNEDHVSHENDEHGSAVTSANIEGDNARSHGSNEDEEAVSHEDHEKVTVVPFGLAFDGSEHDDHEEEDAASNKTDNDEVGENDKADDEDNGDKADENDEADDYDDDDDDDHDDDDALPFVASFNEDKEDSDSHEEKEEKLNEIGDDEDGAVAPEEHTSATVDGDEKVGDSHEKNTDTNPNSEDTEVDEKPASGETDVHIIPSLNNGDAVNSNETDDYDYDYEAKTETSPSHESNGSDAAMFHIGAASHDNTEPNETEEEEEDAHLSHVNQIEDDHNENADVKNDEDDEIADNHIVTSTETAASQEVTEEHKTVYIEAVGIEDAEDGGASGGNSTWKEDENEEEYEDKSDYDYNSKEADLILGGLSEETAVHTESSIVDEGSGHIDDSLKPNEENETHIVREPIVPRVRFQHPLLAVPPHNEESKEVSPSSTGTDDFVATTQMSDVDEEHPDIATEKVIESEDDIQATNVPDGHGLGAPSTIDSDSVVSSSNAENDSIFATPAVMKENIRVKGSESGDSDGSVNEPGVGSQSENPDSDSQSSMGSYIVLGCIMGVIVVLLVYSVVRSRRRNQREKQEEDFGTEMKDVEKSLIPANQYNGGIHPDPHPEDESKTKLLHDPENKDDNEECDDESEKVDSKTTENGVQDHRDTFKHQQSYDAIESQLEPLNASNNTFNPQPKEPISPQPDVQRGHDKIVPQSARDRFFNVKPHHQNDSEHMNGFNDISEVVIEKPPTGSSPATNGYVNGNSDGLVAVHSGSQEQLSNPSSPSSKVKVRETVVEGSIPKKPLYVNRDQNGVSY